MSEAKKKWSALTNDELLQVDGNRDILAGKIQEKYGIVKEDHQQIDEWVAKLEV
jgi:uncharacterized protein YjbJ (UPF0337 family)